MSTYTATIGWTRGEAAFTDRKFSRAHAWEFDGGARVHASASPHVVRVPLSDPTGVDPEEAFVAALSSCHMLWFLDLAAQAGIVVDSYRDQAIGTLEKNAEGRQAMTKVVLHPDIRFAEGTAPDPERLRDLHDRAHHLCYIANSVRTEVTVEPV